MVTRGARYCRYNSFFLSVRISVRPSIFYRRKTSTKTECSVETVTTWTATIDSWSPATRWNGVNLNGDNCGHNGKKQQVKTATTTYTAWQIRFTNYYVAHAFVVCVMYLKYVIIQHFVQITASTVVIIDWEVAGMLIASCEIVIAVFY